MIDIINFNLIEESPKLLHCKHMKPTVEDHSISFVKLGRELIKINKLLKC